MAHTASPLALAALLLVSAMVALTMPQEASAGPLWDYVHKPDPNYKWSDTGITMTKDGDDGYVGHLLNLTSQAWLTPADTTRHIWHHQLLVIIPNNYANHTTAAIYNTGGEDPIPDKLPNDAEEIDLLAQVAVQTKAIASIVWQVPNQPIVFANDPTHASRIEDAAVAFTWWEFMNNPDNPEKIIELPMTKSVVKAMDAVQEFAKTKGHIVEDFMVSGASKRGWTTWLVGAVDTRATAIAPIVMDLLNFEKNIAHMFKAYGGWTFAFIDYYNMNITEYFGNSSLVAPLAAIIDPLVYKENLTMPKLVIDATGDEFFMPDDDHYWWGMLPGETYRLMAANAEHSFSTGLPQLTMSLTAFFYSIVNDSPRPVLDWSIAPDTGIITATSNVKATQAVIRYATTFASDGGRRDFRLFKGDTPHDPCHGIVVSSFGHACFNPVLWLGEDLRAEQVDGGWQYVASQPMPPANEWRGFFIDFYLPGPAAGFTYRFTTQVSIIPQTFPFPACEGDGCKGFLV